LVDNEKEKTEIELVCGLRGYWNLVFLLDAVILFVVGCCTWIVGKSLNSVFYLEIGAGCITLGLAIICMVLVYAMFKDKTVQGHQRLPCVCICVCFMILSLGITIQQIFPDQLLVVMPLGLTLPAIVFSCVLAFLFYSARLRSEAYIEPAF
jgi:hypothetical protein